MLRNELPQVGAALVAGEISYGVRQTIVYRTDLNALADTVCAQDPRTRTQHRADAMGALAADLARLAKLQPLIHPADSAPEEGYTPSRALAEFVRCRGLTCRFPGCDRPAVGCDLDTLPPTPRAGTRTPPR